MKTQSGAVVSGEMLSHSGLFVSLQKKWMECSRTSSGVPVWHFPAISTELLQVSLRSVGADGRKKRELQRHAESQLNYLEEPHGVQRLPGPRLPIQHLHVCLFFSFLLIHWMLKDTNITLLLLLSTITRKTQLKIIIHDIDSLHKPHRLWIQKISQHFSGRTPLIFHFY